MRAKENRFVVAFSTTTDAMAAEKACREAGLSGRLIPLPRVISAGCGLAWSAPEECRAEILELLAKKGIVWELEGVFYV